MFRRDVDLERRLLYRQAQGLIYEITRRQYQPLLRPYDSTTDKAEGLATEADRGHDELLEDTGFRIHTEEDKARVWLVGADALLYRRRHGFCHAAILTRHCQPCREERSGIDRISGMVDRGELKARSEHT